MFFFWGFYLQLLHYFHLDWTSLLKNKVERLHKCQFLFFWSLRSMKCTLTSAFRLWNLPNLFIRCNMSCVVSLSLYTVFIFLCSNIEKVKVIAVFFSKYFNSVKNFIQRFLSSCNKNSLKPSTPKLSNKNISFFGWRSRKPHQWVLFFVTTLCIHYNKWIPCTFFIHHSMKCYKFC